jgi:2-dehydropantoate 2-reductase
MGNAHRNRFGVRPHHAIVDVLVFGAGAIGSFFGALLSQRHDVTLIGREEHISAIKSRGLRVRGKTAMIAKPRAAIHVPRNAKPDFVFVTTKSYDTANAMLALRPFADRAVFVTLQNGLGNAETIAKTARRVVAGTTAHGITFVGPGEIRHAGVGETVVGAWSGVDESNLIRLRDLLADVGIVASVTSDIRTELWSKLVVNASINPIAALAELPNGRIVRDKHLLAVVESVCREATQVGKAEGAHINPEELRHRTLLVAKRTASNRASMLQDLDRHHRTEIDAITGSIVRAANRHRIPVPLNAALYSLVRAKETGFRSAAP